MPDEKRFLVDVGMKDLPFPIRVLSRENPDGQHTVANISIDARIMHDFEAKWIDKFIQIVHRHRDTVGTKSMRINIKDYVSELQATLVRAEFSFPFFYEKLTPVSKEKCLVRYICGYSAKYPSVEDEPKVFLRIEVPVITTYPISESKEPGGLFGQLSIVHIETESEKDIYPEDLVDIVDKHALAPVYSFLTEEDQQFFIRKIHAEKKTSVVMIDEIKEELRYRRHIRYYSVRCSNFGMLHSYTTVIGTEKNMWVPFSGIEDDEI